VKWKLPNALGSSSGIRIGGRGARCGGVGGIIPTAVFVVAAVFEWVVAVPAVEAGVPVYRLRVLVLDDLVVGIFS
jgi:hypothetical protein